MPPLTDTVKFRLDETADFTLASTVIGVAPSPSPTLDGFTHSETSGWSFSVTVVPVTVMLAPLPDTEIASLPSTPESWVGVSVNVPVPLVTFAAMVMVKSATVA